MIIYSKYYYKYKKYIIQKKMFLKIKVMPIFIQSKLYKIFLFKNLLKPRINVSNKKRLFYNNIYFKKKKKKFIFFH